MYTLSLPQLSDPFHVGLTVTLGIWKGNFLGAGFGLRNGIKPAFSPPSFSFLLTTAKFPLAGKGDRSFHNHINEYKVPTLLPLSILGETSLYPSHVNFTFPLKTKI